jgi:hypothetical protein
MVETFRIRGAGARRSRRFTVRKSTVRSFVHSRPDAEAA